MRVHFEFSAIRKIRWYDYAVRFLFGGAITAATGIVAKHFGPVAGKCHACGEARAGEKTKGWHGRGHPSKERRRPGCAWRRHGNSWLDIICDAGLETSSYLELDGCFESRHLVLARRFNTNLVRGTTPITLTDLRRTKRCSISPAKLSKLFAFH
jgi:hypothetical protein